MSIGGQAVMEGVMIKSPRFLTVSVRKKNSRIVSRKQRLKPHTKWKKLPLVRGMVNLWEMMVLGTQALMWSANQNAEEEEKLTKKELAFTLAFSFLLVIVLFVALPYALTLWLGVYEETRPVVFNLVDGLIKIALFLLYLWAISFSKDVRRLFQYHGAEHKSIYCYEAGKKLNVANVKPFSTLHPRCGTSFILLVFILSVLVFAFWPLLIMQFFPHFVNVAFWERRLILFGVRIASIPLVAGLAYEFLKWSARHRENVLVNLLVQPGLWLQKITTKEPDASQMEVAIHSVKQALTLEKRGH